MIKEKILVTGACGQIGTELVAALIKRYGSDSVVPTDIITPDGSFTPLNVLDENCLNELIEGNAFTQIYHLAAILSAKAEKQPLLGWDLNMRGLLNILEAARNHQINRIFWPSSIAVFGPGSFSAACTQHSTLDPISIYGISKMAGEYWCRYYSETYGMDVRSLRYPGLISFTAEAGGGTTDYAVEIFHQALKKRSYTCYLRENTGLPMMYMADAVRATLELMGAPAEKITVRTSYNLAGINFTPREIAHEIALYLPDFKIDYQSDFRQRIADSWPTSIDDRHARHDWGWIPQYDLRQMVKEMLENLQTKILQNENLSKTS